MVVSNPSRFWAFGMVTSRSVASGLAGDVTYSMYFDGVNGGPIVKSSVKPSREWGDDVEIDAAPVGYPAVLTVMNGVVTMCLFPGGERPKTTTCVPPPNPFVGA